MYVPDNMDAYNEYSSRQECFISKLPKCSECGERIQSEHCYEINDELICPTCMNDNHRVFTDDYI